MRLLRWIRLWWNDICPKHGPFTVYCDGCHAEEAQERRAEKQKWWEYRDALWAAYVGGEDEA